MPLDIHQVTTPGMFRPPEEMIEADIVQSGRRCKAGDMAAEFSTPLAGAHNRGHRVPPDDGADTVFELGISRVFLTQLNRDGIDVCGCRFVGQVTPGATRVIDQLFYQEMGSFRAFAFENRLQRLEPFLCFLLV